MGIKTRLCFVFLFVSSFVYSQTSIKGNVVTAFAAIPNFGIETKIGPKMTFQFDVTASFWKSVKGGPMEFVLVFPEVRYYTKAINDGFFVGAHIGGSMYKIQKWEYWHTDYYQEGLGVMFGATVGYQYKLSDRFNLELFLGGGSHLGFYKGYTMTTHERLDGAEKYNKSGELIPYRGGLMLVYKL
ncbi:MULTISPECIES: DUF3575 domain-containing protein [unclassified Flavobacterium]|uniref:DUF3575 domain-containing protein n=1 Tax=unclassified Flavobacterium TaxID=196869 RepID=UPI00086F6C1D|nr:MULTISPECIES: DUF3575 domain-containing protein [unclassified Flavobacterium]MBN9283373.1 DUF3575 domain-containing protein [Flavobacterium sp.]ODS87073.1 MAG: hypothetical protein ABS44_12060 [Chryseobacterium sp. SCN 40-13]OJV69503.1 MAG: hypothetical protein BGO42_14145 [Flavobacterium sp. 40-81]